MNVTASHNPKEYNGYKAYWSDGAQVLAPHDKGIIDEVNKVTIDDVKFEANWDKIQIIGGEMDYDYMTAVHSAMIDQDVINRQKDLNIVYSAMHDIISSSSSSFYNLGRNFMAGVEYKF